MKIYLDLVLFINFCFDFLLLLAVSFILRRNVSLYKLFIGAFVGSISVLTLFFRINSFELFLIKIFISILMCFFSFGFRSFKYFFRNILFLYISSIVLGGSLYLFNIEFSYMNKGVIFYKCGLGLNLIILLIISPIIIYIYIKECRNLKYNYSNYHFIEIDVGGCLIKCTGFVDSGNKLRDPYKKRPIILMNNNYLQRTDLNRIYVSACTISGTKMIECVHIDSLVIDNKVITKDVLLGFIDRKIRIDGVDCLLNCEIMEEYND